MSTAREGSAAEPKASRLQMPRGYEGAKEERLLPWSDIEDRLVRAANYWLATTRVDGRPHVTPIWGVWLEQALYFDGIPTALWARNMAGNPAIALHLESGDDVVILEGTGEDIASVSDRELGARIVGAWDSKYGRLHPDPVANGLYRFRPRTARAWTAFPDDATRWSFEDA